MDDEYVELGGTLARIQEPENLMRWLVKKDGSRVLQQRWTASVQVLDVAHYKYIWRDVPEVQET